MCGVAGVLDFARATEGARLEAAAAAMATAMRHRGPDSAGTWVDAEAGIGLGHRRLAIVDLSPAGHQPMHSASGRFVVSFNGEIYNFQDLRAELEGQGHRFRGHSDTEVMLAAFEQYGVLGATPRFFGMFAFAVWDRKLHTLSLVRDRLGVKPLVYARFGDAFLFASELRALQAHRAFRGEVNREAVALYLRFGNVPEPHTIWRGTFKVPPGTCLTVDSAGAVTEERYWSLRERVAAAAASPFAGDEREATDRLEALLRDSVRRRLVADVPVGVLLSGGIDSSTVAALAQAESRSPIRTFSIGFPMESYDEAESAAQVARHLKTDHTSLTVTPEDALATVPEMPEIADEPFADASLLPTYLVCKLARRQVTVCLSGDGGDEVFAGYNRHLWSERISRAVAPVPPWLRRAAGHLLSSASVTTWDRVFDVVRRGLPTSLQVRNAGEKVHKLAAAMRSTDTGSIYRPLISQWQEPSAIFPTPEPDTVLDRPADWPPIDDLTRQVQYLDTITYLPNDILSKVDRASMAVSLEAREPLLDHRVVEFGWSLPLSFKIRDGAGKWILRQVLYRHVPQVLVERPKWGFAMPIDHWLRGPLRSWAEDLLNERSLREGGLFDPKPIQRVWLRHLSGGVNAQAQLWPVLMFMAWQRRQAGNGALKAA